MTSRRVLVVGQGYVGLPLAMRAWEVGYTVVGLDVDALDSPDPYYYRVRAENSGGVSP